MSGFHAVRCWNMDLVHEVEAVLCFGGLNMTELEVV